GPFAERRLGTVLPPDPAPAMSAPLPGKAGAAARHRHHHLGRGISRGAELGRHSTSAGRPWGPVRGAHGARWAGEKLLHGPPAAVHAVSRNRGAHRLPAGGSVAGPHRGAVSAPEGCQGAGRLPTTPLVHSAGGVL